MPVSRHFALFALLVWGPLYAAPVLTLIETERLALESDNGLMAMQARLEAQAELVDAADRFPDPMLSVAALNYPGFGESDPTNPMQQNMISLSQRFPAGRSLALQKEGAFAAKEQAQAFWMSGKALLLKRIRALWLDVFLLKHKHDLLSKQADAYAEQLKTFTAGLRVSSSSQQEVIELEAELARAEAELITVNGELVAGGAILQRWIGLTTAYDWPDTLPAILRDKPPLKNDLSAHPQLLGMKAAWQKTESDTEVARQAYKPRWSVDLSYAEREIFDNMVSLGVSVEIPFFNNSKQDSTVRAREKEAAAARHEWLDSSLLLHARYRSLWAQLESQSQRLQQYQNQIVPGLYNGVELAQANYQAGSDGYRNWLQAYESYIMAALTMLDIEGDRARLVIDILYLNEEISP